jgi:hypothetical protein
MRKMTGIAAAAAGAAFTGLAASAAPSGAARPPRVATVAWMKPRREIDDDGPASSRSGLLSEGSLCMLFACLETAVRRHARPQQAASMQIRYHGAAQGSHPAKRRPQYRYPMCNFYTRAIALRHGLALRSGLV